MRQINHRLNCTRNQNRIQFRTITISKPKTKSSFEQILNVASRASARNETRQRSKQSTHGVVTSELNETSTILPHLLRIFRPPHPELQQSSHKMNIFRPRRGYIHLRRDAPCQFPFVAYVVILAGADLLRCHGRAFLFCKNSRFYAGTGLCTT